MTVRIFLLPTQGDIIDFRLGHRPANLLVRDFETEAELEAYRDGIDSVRDAYDRIENLKVVGNTVAYTRRCEDPDADAVATDTEVAFGTPAEAEAYRRGIADAEGLAAPLVVDDSDDRFEELLAWTAAGSDCAA
ncbi:MAG: hypothetical protein H6R10_866 [Rhodocyclaceae bacterium]|nr:hypothetical protein [Rhodocyclaceae bacterium]